METYNRKSRPRIEPMYDGQGISNGCKVYGEYPELGYIIRSQVTFAQTKPQTGRRIEVTPEPSGASHIYSSQKLNQEAYKSDTGKQQLIDEILMLVSGRSTIIFDNEVRITSRRGNEVNQLGSLEYDSYPTELRMTTEDQIVFEQIYGEVPLNPDQREE